jgi:hypothetical protein
MFYNQTWSLIMSRIASENMQSIINGIFRIPSNDQKAAPLLYPEMNEDSYALVESLRERVAHAGKQMLIEEIESGHVNALLVGQSEQIAIFIQEFDLYRPRFVWLRKNKIEQLFFPNWVVAAYLKSNSLPGEPPFISGLDWQIELKKEKYWITCSNPPIKGEITYSSFARLFQRMYPEIDKQKPPTRKNNKEESEGRTSMDLNPHSFGGIK